MPTTFFTPFTVWLLLVGCTGLTYAIGEIGGGAVRWLMIGVIGLAIFKGALVVLDYMELRHAPSFWRRVVLGWLLLVASGIVFAYLK